MATHASAADALVTRTQAIMGEAVPMVIEGIGDCFVKPAISAADRGRIHEISKQDGVMVGMVEEIMLRVLDADNKPVFTKADKFKLLKEVDADIISGIFNDIKKADYEGKS